MTSPPRSVQALISPSVPAGLASRRDHVRARGDGKRRQFAHTVFRRRPLRKLRGLLKLGNPGSAGFHFAFIEQDGTSLYPGLAQRVTHPEVLRILLSIGPTETMHFQTWQDNAGNAPPLTDPTNGLVFPDLNAPPFGGEDFQTNLIMPEPTIFLSRKFPIVRSFARPRQRELRWARSRP